MGNPAQVTRKYFRFPAYDDEVGVKLTSGQKRYLFKDEPSMLQSVDAGEQPPTDRQTAVVSPVTAPTPQPTAKAVAATGPAPKKASNTLNQGHTQEQIEELKKHKRNLPDYSGHRSRVAERQKKPSLFGNMHKQSRENLEAASFNRRTNVRKVTSFGEPKKAEQTYFVPTYVPASVIPDPLSEEAIISDQQLLDAMKKTPDSYLLMDSVDTNFQEKRADDPSVQKFNVPKEEPEIPLTRRQYQQIRPNMQRFDAPDGQADLPRSRSELKSAKQQAKNQTAYGQKVSEAQQEHKKGILDKSLSGIIEDSHAEMENTKYFQ